MSLDISLNWSTVTEIALPLLLGIAYFVRVGHLRAHGRAPRRARQAAFAAGLALVVIATVGPLDGLADDFVFGHMIQHTMLFDEASLLLAIGLTGPVLAPLLSRPGVGSLRALTHPVAAVGIWLVVMYGWHLPPLYQAAEESELIHLCEHASFLAAGMTMWLALIGPFPKPAWFGNGARVVYAGTVHFSSMALANILMWSGTVLYPFYVASDRAHGIAPLDDQSAAGVVLMIQGGLVMLCVFFWVLLRWAREDTERQALLDFAHERGIELDEERAARAARAGTTELLRRRLAAAQPGGTAVAAALCLTCLALLLAGCGGGAGASTATTAAQYVGGDSVGSEVAPALRLTDYHGHRVDLAALKGRPVLVAFLYTHCEDLCPVVASKVHTADALLAPGTPKPVFLAVSVDPEHDTPASATKFNREHKTMGEIDWLLGSRPEMEKAWKAWKVLPERAKGDPEVIEHSADITGIGADGKIHVLYPPSFKPALLARDVEALAEA